MTVRATPIESRKSTGSSQSGTQVDADWQEGWDDDGKQPRSQACAIAVTLSNASLPEPLLHLLGMTHTDACRCSKYPRKCRQWRVGRGYTCRSTALGRNAEASRKAVVAERKAARAKGPDKQHLVPAYGEVPIAKIRDAVIDAQTVRCRVHAVVLHRLLSSILLLLYTITFAAEACIVSSHSSSRCSSSSGMHLTHSSAASRTTATTIMWPYGPRTPSPEFVSAFAKYAKHLPHIIGVAAPKSVVNTEYADDSSPLPTSLTETPCLMVIARIEFMQTSPQG